LLSMNAMRETDDSVEAPACIVMDEFDAAATLTLIALLAIVPLAFVPLNAAAAWTKSDPRFEAIAVVM
jgi:hypothetical protein